MAEGLLGPGLLQDLQRIGETLAAFGIGHAIGHVGAWETTAPDAEDQPALAYVIDSGDFLGQSQRVAQRQHLHGDADFHPLGAGCDSGGHGKRRGEHRSGRGDMQFGQPDDIEAVSFRRIHLFEGLRERGGVIHSGRALEFMKHTEFHGHYPLGAVWVRLLLWLPDGSIDMGSVSGQPGAPGNDRCVSNPADRSPRCPCPGSLHCRSRMRCRCRPCPPPSGSW